MNKLAVISLAVGVCGGVALLTLSVGSAEAQAGSGQTKVDICHWDEDAGLYKVITVGEPAVDSHFANHGDVYPSTWYADEDGDGYGDPDGAIDDCPNDGFVDNADDCDDGHADINPAADEICGDAFDNDCDGDVDEVLVTIHLHCDPYSSVMESVCSTGRHELSSYAAANISYVTFKDASVDGVVMHHIVDGTSLSGADMTIWGDTNLCSLTGGCCATTRWNDRVGAVTVF